MSQDSNHNAHAHAYTQADASVSNAVCNAVHGCNDAGDSPDAAGLDLYLVPFICTCWHPRYRFFKAIFCALLTLFTTSFLGQMQQSMPVASNPVWTSPEEIPPGALV
jgi:hypothetical protein